MRTKQEAAAGGDRPSVEAKKTGKKKQKLHPDESSTLTFLPKRKRESLSISRQ